jgi:predicted nucleic acid-binding Zn ribbon protein
MNECILFGANYREFVRNLPPLQGCRPEPRVVEKGADGKDYLWKDGVRTLLEPKQREISEKERQNPGNFFLLLLLLLSLLLFLLLLLLLMLLYYYFYYCYY